MLKSNQTSVGSTSTCAIVDDADGILRWRETLLYLEAQAPAEWGDRITQAPAEWGDRIRGQTVRNKKPL
jgi:hypothetical protein